MRISRLTEQLGSLVLDSLVDFFFRLVKPNCVEYALAAVVYSVNVAVAIGIGASHRIIAGIAVQIQRLLITKNRFKFSTGRPSTTRSLVT